MVDPALIMFRGFFFFFQEIQDTLLPPSVHIIPKKKKKKAKVSQKLGINGINQQTGDKEDFSSVSTPILEIQMQNHAQLNNFKNIKISSRSFSPCLNVLSFFLASNVH